MNRSFRLAYAATFLLVALGCSKRLELPPPGAAQATLQPRQALAVAASRNAAPQGFAALPDRGELIAYPRQPVRHDGAYTWHRTDLSEAHALNAIADGNLRLTTPSGEMLVVHYDRHIEHASGDWTWIGHIPGQDGEQTILTFGAHAAFGSIAQPGKLPLRLTVRNGVSWLIETDPTKVAGIINAATRPQRPDYHIPPPTIAPRGSATTSAPRMASAPATASATTTSSPVTVDLVLGYTPAFATDNGGQSGAITRLNYLVDVSNAAYANSNINARVRLVATVPVSYADATSNDTTLDQLTGYDSSTNSTTSPNSAFNGLRAAREQYGADLVSMVRSFRDPENGGCGVGWLIGGGQQGVSTSDSYYGYSVVSDGTDAGTDGHTYFCLDETLAHELGHNMGANHDVAAAKGTDGVLDSGDYGAYAYSFGYKNAASAFYTVMAYGDTGQHIYRIFSDPRSTFCGGVACGTSQADNAMTLSQTVATVAQFRAQVVPLTSGVSSDIDGDGKSDLLWYNPSPNRFAYWVMSGATITSVSPATSLATGYLPIANGDFNGDGFADMVWSNGQSLSMRLAQAGGGASWQLVGNYPATWKIAGVTDVDGDGKDDLLWYNPSPNRFAYWRMNGATVVSISTTTSLAAGYGPIATGDFNGDGYGDIVWSNGQSLSMRQGLAAGGARWQVVGNYPLSWESAGAADIDGDGKSDLMWHNPSPNRFAFWLMNGAAISYASAATSLSAGYSPIATGDFNGDGYGDIVWSNGQGLSMRLGLANLGASWQIVGSYPSGWKPANPP